MIDILVKTLEDFLHASIFIYSIIVAFVIIFVLANYIKAKEYVDVLIKFIEAMVFLAIAAASISVHGLPRLLFVLIITIIATILHLK